MNRLCCFVLAGGEGKRLKSLTEKTCKPLVKIAAQFHLIDFSIFNCFYSDIYNIAFVVQYLATDLIKYLFESNVNSMGNIYILPPETDVITKEDITYKDTAHSVYANRDVFADGFDDVLILSADHVYSMDYRKFYEEHKESGADLSVSCMEVSEQEARRFGVFEVDESGEILSFEEKPENPKGNLASMGVYIFKKDLLMEVFEKFAAEGKTDLDFGRDIIPYYLRNYNVHTYKFTHFWADLGTIDSFWRINMAILDSPEDILKAYSSNRQFKVLQNSSNLFPTFMASTSKIDASLLGKNCFIGGNIVHSVIGDRNHIQKDAVIENSVLMDGCTVKEGVTVKYAVISDGCVIEEDIIGDAENIISV